MTPTLADATGDVHRGHHRAAAELRGIDFTNRAISGCDGVYPRLHTPLMLVVDY